jgi:hypothetical protein
MVRMPVMVLHGFIAAVNDHTRRADKCSARLVLFQGRVIIAMQFQELEGLLTER